VQDWRVRLGYGQVDYGQGGFQADAGRGFEVDEDGTDGFDGEVDVLFELFAVEEGSVVLGVGEGLLEGGRVAPPVGEGVAVEAGLFRGGSQSGAG